VEGVGRGGEGEALSLRSKGDDYSFVKGPENSVRQASD
jgi:hypothetical protein